MKLPTVKFQSGQVVSLAAFLLKMTSLPVRHAPGFSINQGQSSVLNAGTPSCINQKEERHERRSFQGEMEPI
jgi:hypothetical protein